MFKNLRARIIVSLESTMRSIAAGDENDSYFHGRLLARSGLLFIDSHPEIFNYPECYRPMILDRKMFAANDRG